MKKEEQLRKQLDEAVKADSEAFHNCPLGLSYEGFQEHMAKTSNEVQRISREYRLIVTPEFKGEQPGADDDVMTIEDFIECCNDGGFIDYDGSGTYLGEEGLSNIDIYPSDVDHDMVRKDFKKIVWYNR
jgi:hypothetical protein